MKAEAPAEKKVRKTRKPRVAKAPAEKKARKTRKESAVKRHADEVKGGEKANRKLKRERKAGTEKKGVGKVRKTAMKRRSKKA